MKRIKILLMNILPYPMLVFIMKLCHVEDEKIVLKKLLHGKKGIAIDVGANIGTYSLFLSKAFKNLTIHSFEPEPSLCNFIKTINRKNVFIHNIALSFENLLVKIKTENEE